MPAGRPSKYSGEMLEKAVFYVDNYQSLGDRVPSIVGLCLHLDIARPTAYDWAGDGNHEEFSYILGKCQDVQHNKLLNGGLGGEFNANITKMMLTKHGYSDKQEIDHTSAGEQVTGLNVTFVKPKDEV